MATGRRWPSWVYGAGEEPDVRFSMANERTFLAWIRTAMALLAGGVAVDVVRLRMTDSLQRSLAVLLLGLGILCAIASWVRWARSERAMRTNTPLPSPLLAAALATGLVLVGGVLVAFALR